MSRKRWSSASLALLAAARNGHRLSVMTGFSWGWLEIEQPSATHCRPYHRVFCFKDPQVEMSSSAETSFNIPGAAASGAALAIVTTQSLVAVLPVSSCGAG